MKRLSLFVAFLFALTIGWVSSSYKPISDEPATVDLRSTIELPVENHAFVKVLDLDINKHTTYQNIDFDFVYTSFIFEISRDADFVSTTYTTKEKEVFYLDSIPQTDQPGDERRSPFIIPNTAQKYFNFYSGNLEGSIRIYLFYAPPVLSHIKKSLGKKSGTLCEKPQLISGNIWRDGLPKPTGKRENHTVNHTVIHHAASSNANHDYINVVRNIYLLHTQTNGWDDIGYNFVVAQDGSIFEGRDHQNIDSTDNIKGAHFCGKNTNTMGICVLGNYQDIAPTNASLNALTHLLTWKCFKNNISALGSSPHPTSNSNALGHIAGHQDGCATACPGDSLYRLLPMLRSRVDSIMATCGNAQTVDETLLNLGLYWYQPNDCECVVISLNNRDITKLQITNLSGQIVWKASNDHKSDTYHINDVTPGIYYLSVENDSHQLSNQPILVR